MSPEEKQDKSRLARLAQLKTIAEQEFGNGQGATGKAQANRLLALVDDLQALLAEMRACRDEIGSQLRTSVVRGRATAAYLASAGLGKKQK